MAIPLTDLVAKRKVGRPKGSYSAKRAYLDKLSAAQVLASFDERKLWRRLLSSEDDRVVLDAVKFLVVMRDGKPVQQINVATTNLNISVADIAKARALAQQLIGRANPSQAMDGHDEGVPMLRGDDGDKKDGDE